MAGTYAVVVTYNRRDLLEQTLAGLEAQTRPPDHIVVIQVESLGFAVLDHVENGREVTPFLNHLPETSLFYRIRASHRIGSADADFAMLTGKAPSREMITYKIRGYPYDNSLPHLLNRLGYRTSSLHGASGRYYGRRPAFEQMGFSQCRRSC